MNNNSYRTMFPNQKTVGHSWLIVDLEGKALGRASSKIASLLLGKHKVSYSRHVECGDCVIVLNAGKVSLSGKKLDQNEHIWYSGFPGGQKRESLKTEQKRDQISLVKRAIKRMLPKNRLGRSAVSRLRVYPGTSHPHEAQQAEKIEV